MSYTIVGLFPNQKYAKEISEGIEKTGIKNEDYIIYKTQKNKTDKSNFWKKLLGIEKAPAKTEVESLITSVAIRNEEELNNIKKSFKKMMW